MPKFKINKNLLILSLLCTVFGCWFLVSQERVITTVISIFLATILFILLLLLVYYLIIKDYSQVRKCGISVLVVGLLWYLNKVTLISSIMVVWLLGIYQIFMASVYLITYVLYRKYKVAYRRRYLIDGVILFVLGITTIFSPVYRMDIQFLIIAIYLIFLGIRYFREGLFFTSDVSKNDFKRKVHINVPVIVDAMLPGQTLAKINESIAKGEENVLSKVVPNDATLEIYIHAGEGFQGATGHADLCFEGEVITYGCYDTPTTRFFGTVSDGTLIKFNREEYLQFCQDTNDRVFGYTIAISYEQANQIRKKIAEIDTWLIPWNVDIEAHKKLNTQTYQFTQLTHAKYYKFNSSSRFETYFVATTNCSVMTDLIVGSIGTEILNVRGFVTPGTYKSYLDREFSKENSIVVDYNVY